MSNYTCTVEVTYTVEVEVEAEDEIEAAAIAMREYYMGDSNSDEQAMDVLEVRLSDE